MVSLVERLFESISMQVDGAMGAEFLARGLTIGDTHEMWNIKLPGDIIEAHKGSIIAVFDMALTNSCGGTALQLKLDKLQGRVHKIKAAAARCARAAALAFADQGEGLTRWRPSTYSG